MKMREKLKKSFVGFFLLVSLSGCAMEDLNIEKLQEVIQFEKQPAVEAEREVTEEQEAFYYGYQNLPEEEQKIYRQLMTGLETFQEEIVLSPIAQDRLEVIANMVMIDHPEYFWTEGGFRYYEETWPQGKTISVKVLPDYLMGQEEAEQIKSRIEAKAQEWIAGVSSGADTYEKIKYVYETLIREVSYNENSRNNQNIQSVFLDGSTVCMGYAKATQYLLKKMGIFCTLVTGTITDGTDAGHAWNLVKIEDSFYYVDTTWGNPGYSDSQDAGVDIYYSYLCCNAETLAPTHKANEDIPLPACEDDSYNYYKRKGCWYENYDRNQIYQSLLNTISGEHQITEFCFGTREAYEQAVSDVVEGNLLQDAVRNSSNLSPGQQVSWQIYYGGWDNLLVIVWN